MVVLKDKGGGKAPSGCSCAPSPVGGSGGMLFQENFILRLSEMASGAFLGKYWGRHCCSNIP